MGQQDIFDILKKSDKALSGSEIASQIDINPKLVFVQLTKLLIRGEIKCIEINSDEALVKYNCKRRMRLYFLE